MEEISSLKKYLLTVHPVRKTGGQKKEFRQWLLRELKCAGWKAGEETYGKLNGSVNVVAGDPERAEVFLCAHYDTGSRMLVPNFVSPTNVLAHVCYHLAAAMGLAAAALLLSFAVSFPLNQPKLMLPLFLILAVAGLWFAAYGPANQNNANGNSSGVLPCWRRRRRRDLTSGCVWCFWTITSGLCWEPLPSGKSMRDRLPGGCLSTWTAWGTGRNCW